jgi:hypothetical protein
MEQVLSGGGARRFLRKGMRAQGAFSVHGIDCARLPGSLVELKADN